MNYQGPELDTPPPPLPTLVAAAVGWKQMVQLGVGALCLVLFVYFATPIVHSWAPAKKPVPEPKLRERKRWNVMT